MQQVLEVVLKTKMDERIGGEKLVEVSPDGKRRVLEPEESPYQVRKGNFEKKTCFASKSLPCSDPLSSSASLVAGAWTEREKMYHGGSFLKLADDNVDIQNPEAQNRELSGF